MANGFWTVYVPDRATPYTGFPLTMDIEEVRASLVATGVASVSSASFTNEGSGIVRFNRVQGGSKGRS